MTVVQSTNNIAWRVASEYFKLVSNFLPSLVKILKNQVYQGTLDLIFLLYWITVRLRQLIEEMLTSGSNHVQLFIFRKSL